MQSGPLPHWEPGHACELCGHPATMPPRDETGWLCATCYILTTLMRVRHIDDPSTVHTLATWLADSKPTRQSPSALRQ
jgi:hypothetical protein